VCTGQDLTPCSVVTHCSVASGLRARGDALGQIGDLAGRRRLHPAESDRAIGALVKVELEVQRTAKALDQDERAGVGRPGAEPGFPDEVRGDDALDDAQHA